MRYKKIRQIITIVTIICVVCINTIYNYENCFSQSMTSNFTNVILTGVPENDIVAVAEAQAGKTQAQLGYTEAWCADFVSDCAKIAGLSYAVPANANVYGLYNNIINVGGTVVTNPQKGDIVFYRCSACNGWMHVAIMQDSVHSIHGNYWYPTVSQVYKNATVYYDENGHSTSNYISCTYVRPKYISGHNPTGHLDSVEAGTGYIKVRGWAFDDDSLGTNLKIHVYVGGTYVTSLTANKQRDDVNEAYNNVVGPNHGFDDKIYISKDLSGSKKVSVYAINVGGGADVLLGEKTVNIGQDSTAPIIKDVKITNLSSKGYTVTCTVTDNVAVDRVQFPTWIPGQQVRVSNWGTNPEASGTISGNTVTYRVNTADYDNKVGEYATHIYAYDKAGNQSSSKFGSGITIVSNGIVPVNVDTYNGHIYAYFADCYTWHEAKKICETMGGHLVTITSAEENTFVNNLTGGYHAFIGLTDEVKEGTWQWVTGETVNYTNWMSGAYTSNHDAEDYVWIRPNGQWNDDSSAENWRVGFVLEIDSELKPTKEVTANGYLYRAYDVSMPWEVAKVYCEQYGGSLAVPTSESENTSIKNLLPTTGKSYYFLGISDKAEEGKWVDVNGNVISYSNWGSGEPNGGINENYIVTGRNAKWNDTRSYDDFNGFIYQKVITVTGITLNKTSLTLTEGGNETLQATIQPSNAKNKTVTWSSSNTSIATVDSSGKVTAVKAGTATISAKSNNGKTASCTVTVKAKTVDVTGITLNKTSLTLTEGGSETLQATIQPSSATNKTVTWSSSNTSIATVDSSGKVTAVKAGTATISAKSNNGKTVSCTVAVKAKTIYWVKDNKGWWYQNADGTYPKNEWKQIAGKWYHFDANGYMQTGWYAEGKTYYYLKADGSMATDEWVENGKYYVDSTGKWIKDKIKTSVGWNKDSKGWWYKNADGTYPKNEWKQISGKWYHFDASGYMQTGWYVEGKTYYYLKADGSMAADEWVEDGKYYVDKNGKWVKDKVKVTEGWVKDSKGWWYQNADGTYPKNEWKQISGKWYHFDASGYMQTGWYKEGSVYYYLKSDGSMAVNEWVDNGKYYVDSQGHWVQGKSK